MTVINTNVKALYSQGSLKVNQRDMKTAMQQLSTGKRINSSADDAAGLAISDRMTQQIRSLNMAVRNAGDAISLIQTTEGATGEINNMLQRMRELALQAINDTNTGDQRGYLNIEFQQLKQEIARTASMTEWNGFPVLTGEAGVRVGVQPLHKAVSEGTFNQVFVNPTTTRPVSGDDAGEVQKVVIGGTPATGFLTIGGVDVTLTSTDIASTTTVAAKIKEVLDLSSAYGSGSGRTIIQNGANLYFKYAASEGDVAAITYNARATGTTGTITSPVPAITNSTEAFSSVNGKFKKSGTISIDIPASTTASESISATFTDLRGAATTMSATLNRTNSTVTFAATGNNADIISHELTYTFNNPSGTAIGGTANVGLDDFEGALPGDSGGTDTGRAVKMDIAIDGGLPAMNVGDIVINGIVIGASNGSDDSVSPVNNSAGSAIARAAAINAKSSLTNVKAVVNENQMHGAHMTKGAQVTGVVFVNGVSSDTITSVPGSTRETRINAVNAINRISHKTGVTAVDTGSDAEGVKLVAKDGRNIEVTFETTASTNDFQNRTGLRTGVQGGTYSLESKAEQAIVITSDTGKVSNSGLRVGDYTTNQTVMSTMDRAKVQEPVPQVSKVTIATGVTNADAATFSAAVNGTTYTVTTAAGGTGDPASGGKFEAIRDGLVTKINADLTATVTASKGPDANSLLLTAKTAGSPFLLDVSSSESSAISAETLTVNNSGDMKTLNEGDLIINGTKIRATLVGDDKLSSTAASSSKRDASAIAISAAINSHSATTKVKAQVNATETKGQKTDTSLDVSGTQSLYVNGVKIDINMTKNETGTQRREKVLAAVNARFGQHGVTASDNGGGVTLSAADGRNVSAWFDSNVANLQAAAFGLERSGTVKQVSRITVTSGVESGDRPMATINGVTVTGAAAGATTAASLAASLKTAIDNAITAGTIKNIATSISGGIITLTSSVAGTAFTVEGIGHHTDTSKNNIVSAATVTKNSFGDNDVIGILNASATSTGAKTVYGTVDLVSTEDKPFTVEPGVNGYKSTANFAALGFREGTFGGKSSEEMSPPKVGRLSFQVGASAKQVITVDLPDFGKAGPITNLVTKDVDDSTKTVKIDVRTDAETALDLVDRVVDLVNENRATMGAVMNRLNYAIDTLTNVSMNQVESRSRVMDADYAVASTELARTQIIQQAATAVLAQANVDQQTVLRLLE